MGMIFLMSNSFQKTTTENLGDALLESVKAKIETSLIELKALSKNSQNASITAGIPELIGEQKYVITAKNSTFEIRTFGDPSLVKEYGMDFWNASLQGSVFSSKGKIQLEFLAANNTVTFK